MELTKNHKRLKLACYIASLTMSATCNLTPILFLTFRSLYGISYSLLGTLVVINFLTQLIIDLIFSFFSHKFNISLTVKLMPFISALGLLLFALAPLLFPQNVYIGLAIATAVFSLAAGLGEVLTSPLLATIPFKNPDREMSKLHSVYAWGTVGVVILSTLFLLYFKGERWQYLALAFTSLPLISAALFLSVKIPRLDTPQKTSGAVELLKNPGVWLSFVAIFLGGAAECTMSQWASGYLEQALGIPKLWGDLFGVALFALFLGLGRTLYGICGKRIERVLVFSGIGASICYLTAALSPVPVISLIACALTGFCTAMLWPGNLVVASSRFPNGGVFIYALMAAGGDMGASVVPQLVGIITDKVMLLPGVSSAASALSLTSEQLGMKAGMLFASIIPIISILIYLIQQRAVTKK